MPVSYIVTELLAHVYELGAVNDLEQSFTSNTIVYIAACIRLSIDVISFVFDRSISLYCMLSVYRT